MSFGLPVGSDCFWWGVFVTWWVYLGFDLVKCALGCLFFGLVMVLVTLFDSFVLSVAGTLEVFVGNCVLTWLL